MGVAPNAPDASRIVALLTRQRDLYRELRALSEKQRNTITGDRPEMLLSILRDRQELVNELARLNHEMGPLRRNWEAAYAALPAGEREQAAALLQEINGLLRVILRTDQEDGALLAARKQAVAAEIAGLAGGQQVNAAYARQAGTPAAPAADVSG